jgi:hypothetical protein
MLTQDQVRLLRLALRPVVGCRNKTPANYYLAHKGTDEDLQWKILAQDGYAIEFRDGITIRTWKVTAAGKAALEQVKS